MAKLSQSGRSLVLTTPLGPDVLAAEALEGREAISELFEFRLKLIAEKQQRVAFNRILGHPVTIQVTGGEGPSRVINGLVVRFRQLASDETFSHFEAVVAPKVWLLTQSRDCRIFQQKTVPDILKEVFDGYDVKFSLQGQYPAHNYCTQYEETDFDFASRLMEEEGIFYYFEHASDRHTLVIADESARGQKISSPSEIAFDAAAGGRRDQTRIHEFATTQEIRPAKVSLTDYSFQLADKILSAESSLTKNSSVGSTSHTLQANGATGLEWYHFPGDGAHRFDDVPPGGGDDASRLQGIYDDQKRIATLRMERFATEAIRVDGASNCPRLTPGRLFTLTSQGDGNGDYLIVAVEHSVRVGDYRSTPEGGRAYLNRFEARPAALPFRPALDTPRPRIAGPQTAVVVGSAQPSDYEISCDKYGRVKVQFFWDREGKKDLASSCWVRVSQGVAGPGFGAIQLPRIGHEVVVTFLEGDPDRPLIVGSVYNSANPPPYDLPANRAISGQRSRSKSSSSTKKTFSHMLIDDTSGSEKLHFHSENHFHQSAESSMVTLVGWGPKKSGEGGGPSGPFIATPERTGDEHPIFATPGPEPFAPTGSGSGGGWTAEPAQTEQVRGNQLETVWGLNNEFVFGGNGEAVLGYNYEGVLGLNFELVVPINAEVVLGSNSEAIIGTNLEMVYGYSATWCYGTEYTYVAEDLFEWVQGSYYEKVSGNNLVTLFGSQSNVIEFISDDAGYETFRQYYNQICALLEKPPQGSHGDHAMNQASTDLIKDSVKAFASKLSILQAQAAASPAPARYLAKIPAAQQALDAATAAATAMCNSAKEYTYGVINESGNTTITSLTDDGILTLLAKTVRIIADDVQIFGKDSVEKKVGAAVTSLGQPAEEVVEQQFQVIETLAKLYDKAKTIEKDAANAAFTANHAKMVGAVTKSAVAAGLTAAGIAIAAPVSTKYWGPSISEGPHGE